MLGSNKAFYITSVAFASGAHSGTGSHCVLGYNINSLALHTTDFCFVSLLFFSFVTGGAVDTKMFF